ncbi:PREDICTED: helicase domino isoform X2 [Nicrophorus vespilloides]|uniref:Helicase domino isoform X2 n=1 Tax=Nicrophorus vespilloides TaxID=110193 RepID=A0ABM1MXN2_NICVS|nr:PREDICTED: helicase domino isoform X2 [Nicrophorus vespilloides]
MSDETPGAGHGSMPLREGAASRPVRFTQVSGGQYVLTTQSHSVPALTQISGTAGIVQQNVNLQQGGVTRIISISPSSSQSTSSQLRPSQTNQSIVKALTTKSRPNANVRLQLFGDGGTRSSSARTPIKRSLPATPEKKDTYAAKLQRVMNHRNVRSKIVREKYNEHLLENYHLEVGGNILDLYQFAKRPKTQQFLAYIKENAIDPKEYQQDEPNNIGQTVPPMPTATAVSSLPGMSSHASVPTTSTPPTVVHTTTTTTSTAQSHQEKEPVKTSSSTTTNKIKTPVTYLPNPPNNQEQIVEKAKQEAYVVQRISDLQKEGLWSEKRLPKVQEMPRVKAHWDFLLEEMVWLAADFAQERKWKKAAAKKCARMVQKYFQDKALAAQRAEKAHEQHIRRVAAFCAKEIKNFWSNVEKLVEYKQNTRLEEKRKKALDQHLSFIVDQTEKYSQLLAEGMNKPINDTSTVSNPVSRTNSDDEFQPDTENDSDDEETIAQEEAADTAEKSEEVAALQRESQMDFEDFLSELPKDYLQNRDKIRLSASEDEAESSGNEDNDKPSGSSKPSKSKKKDEDFKADFSSDDDEDTIQEQEKAEGALDHKEELDDLNAEAEMDIEELRRKYASLPATEEDSNMSAVTTETSNKSSDYEPDEGDDSSDSGDDSGSESDLPLPAMEISEAEEEDDKEVGLKSLLDDTKEGEDTKTDNNDLINDAAAIAESIQPKGNTLSSTSVVTTVPFLLKLPLREYQHIGLDWLVTMFERKLNGILADEMGLGKTIQTIALLAHLACEKENWGPHLIVVPTSVMLNWEMECKKWCPGFKILTYYGTQKERKMKRTGWTKPNAFHICITSYKLVIQDHQSFRRKKWKYLILDEAQNIKNFKSQRWQLLLNFQTQQRLLLTGTPLQNNLMELWSLMHFLMPNVFQSHREFKEWFSNPVTGMIEGNNEYNENIIKRLHKVLRPFLLRRLKSEVEKQMPKKYEHVIMCRLSKRQRFLYDDYMSRAKTKETLASGNLLSVINVLMQLRKVCNHPNLFEVRPTISPFHCEGILEHIPSIIYSALSYDVWKDIDLNSLNLNLLQLEYNYSAYQCYRLRQYCTPKKLIEEIDATEVEQTPPCPPSRLSLKVHKNNVNKAIKAEMREEEKVVPAPPPVVAQQNQTNQKLNILGKSYGMIKALQIAGSSATTQSSGGISNIPIPGFAQLVQTSTGKHILLTPTLNANNIGISGTTTTVRTSSGQKLTVLSKQPVATTANATPSPSIAKAIVKVQLTSLTSTAMSSEENKLDDNGSRKTVGTKFIEKLYLHNSKSTRNLDVRWQNSDDKLDIKEEKMDQSEENSEENHRMKLNLIARVNQTRCSAVPIYGKDFIEGMQVLSLPNHKSWVGGLRHCSNVQWGRKIDCTTDALKELIYTPVQRIEELTDIFNRYIVYVPAVHAPEPELQIWNPHPSLYWGRINEKKMLVQELMEPTTPLHQVASAMVTQFPHPRLIQYDCGKLQRLDRLLRKLKYGSHRVLIFTQMTKMLDVLEAFLNFHGHIYLRLDGSTKIDQRQILMERFNGDARIFAFILSTRSGGVGVNLTGADTVIFYDSDWNPTMDAQAQDRCHRIGQTRDVHIYRLVSEMTIEENILKKANQKRLLGDLAIEGGNFTTAYFKSTTIQDIFNIDATEESAANRMSEVVEISREREKASEENNHSNDEKTAMGALESALAACEDDQDVIAARTAKAEAVADLAEFDENIPLEDQEKDKEPEISKAEQEVENLVKQLTPIERYAMRFIEETEAAWSAEQLAAAEREIEDQKREWEENRIAAMKEEELRRARELEEESELLTFPREDATNQIWVCDNTNEQMPMWCPPTPPQQDGDMYLDQTMSFLYDTGVMTENQLPPPYVKKEVKRTRSEAGLPDPRRGAVKIRKEESTYPPRSLFERPSPTLLKIRRSDVRLHKFRGTIYKSTGPVPGVKYPTVKPSIEPPCLHNWTIHEDNALLKVVQTYQGSALNLMIRQAGHTLNWDFVADYVNTVSIAYRSPKQCRNRYENVLVDREEGKQAMDTSPRKKKNQKGQNVYKFPIPNKSNSRPMCTSQLYQQDNNISFTQLITQRHDTLMTLVSTKKTSIAKPVVSNPLLKNPKHAMILSDAGIDIDHPILPVEVAARRAERTAREKKITPEMAQKIQMMRAAQNASAAAAASSSSASASTASPVHSSSPSPQITVVQTSAPAIVSSTVTPNTPPTTLRAQRIVASPLQNSTVVSVSGITPAQLQNATQRLIVSGTGSQAKATVVSPAGTVSAKSISPAQLHLIRQASLKQQLRLQSGSLAAQGVKTTTVTIAGQPAVQVQFTQAQQKTQYIKPGTVTVSGKQGMLPRTITESEMAQLIKRQNIAQKFVAGQHGASMHSLSPQVIQALQAGPSGTQVATLVKAVSSAGVTQTVIGTPVKALSQGLKATPQQQLRTLQIHHQQILAQKKLANSKIAGIAQVAGKSGVATQLIVGSKPMSTAMTVQQLHQAMRAPINQGPVLLAKGPPPRVIPLNGQGTKPTIQVVQASQGGITTTIRPQTSSTLAGALTGIKVQGSAQNQQTILTHVSAALQGQHVRQNSPVRIQTTSGTPLVAVTVQSGSPNVVQPGLSQQNAEKGADHVSRFLKK